MVSMWIILQTDGQRHRGWSCVPVGDNSFNMGCSSEKAHPCMPLNEVTNIKSGNAHRRIQLTAPIPTADEMKTLVIMGQLCGHSNWPS